MSLRLKVFVVFLIVIAASLTITIALVRGSVESEGTSRIKDALIVGERVFVDKLHADMEKLTQNTTIVANDDALRQALFDDPKSLQVALDNFLARLASNTDAEMMWLLDVEGHFIASSGVKVRDTRDTYLSLIERAEEDGWSASSIVPVNGTPYILSAVGLFVPVKAPYPSFWLITGSRFDSQRLAEFEALTSLELVVLSHDKGTSLASSLSTPLRDDTLRRRIEQPERAVFEIEHLEGHFLSQRIHLPSEQVFPLDALLLKSKRDIERQLKKLNIQLYISGLIVLLIAALVTAYLSKSITRPLLTLVEITKDIAKGRYRSILVEDNASEISILANAFNQMQNEISEREKKIEYIAYHDELTDLPNRAALVQKIESCIQANKVQRFAVCVLDIDRFKEINDTLGHNTGDRVLAEFSNRLKEISDHTACIARLGGDEFAIFIHDAHDVDSTIDRLYEKNKEPVNLEGIALDVRISTGVSVYPEHGESANSLLQTAEIAMYLSKEKQDACIYYEKSQDPYSVQRLTLIAELKSAIKSGQLELHFQPKLDIKNQVFRSVECLVRWIHPRYGFINPEEFIGYAEQTGVIKHLTRWVVETALKQAKEWRNRGWEINVAINISAIDLGEAHFPEFVVEKANEYGVPTKAIVLEVTESAVMRDVDQAISALNKLKDLGVLLSIDDYGQGYSSMAQLKKLPVHELKIDKAFVLNLTEDCDDLVIVKSTIELAHNMGLRVVAEGVESQHSLGILAQYGCEYAQGFHLSRPLNNEKFDLWLKENENQVQRV